MKIIHTADIHLGSKMDSSLPKSLADERKNEIRNTFLKMTEYAKENGVSAIIIAGDLFDSDNPFKKDKDFFYGVVKNCPDIDFLYLRGNHDVKAYGEETPENLKTFSDNWTAYSYGNVNIVGTELSQSNILSFYSTLSLPADKINIVTLHGQTGDAAGDINIRNLREKNIDYLALGHVHKPQSGKIDDRGFYAYCGCLEGRGFDEPGNHGFILIDTEKGLKTEFVPFAKRKIVEADVDISGVSDHFSIYKKVKESVSFNENDIYRINLVGEISAETEITDDAVAKYLEDLCVFVSVKDKTSRKINIKDFENDISVRGEFVRQVMANDEYGEEEKAEIIRCGLAALSGKEFGF